MIGFSDATVTAPNHPLIVRSNASLATVLLQYLSCRVSGATIRDTLIGVLGPLFKTQTPDKTAKPTKAHGLFLIQRKGKDSKKPSVWPLHTPLEPAE